MEIFEGHVQKVGHSPRRYWGIVGMSLVFAAILTVMFTNLHIRGLPSKPSFCNTIDCSDAIYALRTPYAWIAVDAVLVGFMGFIMLRRSRPIRWAKYSAPPRARTSASAWFALLIGLLIGIWLPWLIFMMGSSTSVPKFTLLAFLGAGIVHFTLWWRLRWKTGRDRGAWSAALTIQVLTTLLLVPNVLTQLFVPMLLPLAQLASFFIGVAIATWTRRPDNAGSPPRKKTATGSNPQPALTGMLVGLIAIAATWASWAQPVPENLQARLDNGR